VSTGSIGTNAKVRVVAGGNRMGPAAVWGCLLLCAVPLILVWQPMRLVFALALQNDTYTHIPLIPMVSLFLIYSERRSVFSVISSSWAAGSALIIAGAIGIALARFNVWQMGPPNELSLVLAGFVLFWMGAFLLFFGARAFRAALFPLLFLLFTIPIPEPILSWAILQLQEGSAKAAAGIFSLLGIPYLQSDLIFSLPGVAIRVAEECSGIRSTLALLIMAVLASHLFLKTTWKQLLLCILVVPMSIAKNGLRIATLSALSIYVDSGFLHGRLHEYGGMVFFAAALVPLALLCGYLQKTEATAPRVAFEASPSKTPAA
jgi:exosortase